MSKGEMGFIGPQTVNSVSDAVYIATQDAAADAVSQATANLALARAGIAPSVSAPLTGGGASIAGGPIGIIKATALTDGYLAKEDFATFAASPGAAPVADLTALGALDATGFPAGTRRFVVSVADTYTLYAAGYTPDGVGIVAATPAGFWVADLVGRWDDEPGDISQGTGNAALTYEVYRDTSFKMYFFRHGQTDELSIRFQFKHGIDKTTPVIVHLHVIPMSAPIAPQNVRFAGEYAWAQFGTLIPDEAGWTQIAPFVVPYGAADQRQELIINLATIPAPPNLKGSDMLLVHVERTGADAGDTYDTAKGSGTAQANLGLVSLDCHYRKATEGSVTVFPT